MKQPEKSGIQKHVTVHTLRHTYATHLLEDGLDIVSIKELLGHSFIETHDGIPARGSSWKAATFLPHSISSTKKLDRCVPLLKWPMCSMHSGRRSHAAYSLTLGNCVPWMQSADAARHPWADILISAPPVGICASVTTRAGTAHCPKCQQIQRERWILAREADLLPVPYFHVVFTLPEELNQLCLYEPAKIYKLLFDTVWSVIRSFAQDEKQLGAETGMISILHTWGQNLSLHPHLHCIVPGGGINQGWSLEILAP